MIRRLRTFFLPEDGFEAILAGTTVAVLATDGELSNQELAARVFPWLGHRWMANGHPLTVDDVGESFNANLLLGLDLIETAWPRYRAGPSARTLLPRATALAHYLTRGTSGT